MKKALCALFATATISAFAVGKGTDSKGEYWEDSAGVKHYYLFQSSYNGKRWSIANNAYARADARAGTGSAAWVSGSIFAFERETTYSITDFACNPVTVFYGIELEALNGGYAITFEGTSAKYTIGEYGIHSVSGNTIRFMRGTEGEEIHLAASQTWSGSAASELSSAPLVILPNYAYTAGYRGYVTAEDDVVLTIEGDTLVPWLIYDHPVTNMDIVVKSPAILAIQGGYNGIANLNTRKLTIDGGCGIKFGSDLSFIPVTAVNNANAGATKYGIGSQTIISPVKVAQTIVLTNSATLTALETTTVSGGVVVVSAGTATNAFSGTFQLLDDDTVLRIPAGAVLDLTAATFTDDGRFSVEGEGTLRLDCSVNDATGLFYLPTSSLENFGGDIVVAGGTLMLDDAASIPSGKVVTTEGEGNLLLVNTTGFDASTQMGGTKAVAEQPPSLVVTDAEVTGDVVVNNGETLRVFGSGLGANASLTLWGGSTVMFRRTATVSAPTCYTNDVHYKTFDASVTGTVASAFSVTKGDVSKSGNSTSELYMHSPGELRFTGSGQLRNFRMVDGNVVVTGVYDVYGGQNFYGGHMTVRDGGTIKIKNGWQYLNLCNNTTKDTCLEIAEGGHYEKVSGNCYTYVGRSAAYESKLLLTGGTYIHKYDLFELRVGGVIEVRSGLLQTGRRITCAANATTELSKVLLKGGMFYIAGNSDYAFAIFDGPGSCTVNVDGYAGIRHSGPAIMRDSTNETTSAQATWTCAEGARLKVVGAGDRNDSTLVLHNFEADGLVFDFNTSDYNDKKEVVRIIDPKDPIGIGFMLPGKTGSKIVASDAEPALVASYVVPAGQTLDATALPSGWYEGFGEVSVSNIIFETGSTFRFPAFGDAAPLAISGQLALPDAMNYSVVQAGQKAAVTEAPVIVPALGTVEAPGGSSFTCTGGVKPSAATLSVVNDALAFSYNFTGAIILIW